MYIKSNLLPDERIVHWARPHWILFVSPVFILLIAFLLLSLGQRFRIGLEIYSLEIYEIVSLICFLLAALTGLMAYIRYETSEYAITNKRILMKTGWISRNVLELFLTKIEAIHVKQTVMGRLLNYGTLIVIGTGGTQDPFPFVPHPLKFRRITQIEVDRIEKRVSEGSSESSFN